ncbi:ag-1 blood stage membrane protein homologue [Plasmodium sp. gorilla clade G1]|nr:ag-1 blood stage membrane protein homologue [Plasmodium sp. gorilla clade G1]
MLGTKFILNIFKNKFNNLSTRFIKYVIKSYKRTCPHISDFEPFSSMYYYTGLHNYRTFYLLIKINEIFNINKYKQIYIIVNTDKYDFTTDDIETNKKNRIYLDQRVDIKIRQCDEVIRINLFTTKLTKKVHIGEIKIDINASIISKCFPKNEWFVCIKDGQEVCKVQLSFYKTQKYACPSECMFIHDGLEIWKDKSKSGSTKKIDINNIHKNFDDNDEHLAMIDIDTDINDISLIQKLKLISFVLEQEICVFDFYAYVLKYMYAKEIMGEWFLCFLCFKNNKDQEEINIETIIERNIHRDINIPMLNIQRIVVDKRNNTNANIIYTYQDEKYTLSIHSKKNLYYIIDAITIFTNDLKILKESFGDELEYRKNIIMKENTMKKLMGKRRLSSPRFRKNLPKSTHKMIKEMYDEQDCSHDVKESNTQFFENDMKTNEIKNDNIQTDEIKNDHIQTEELKNDNIQTDEIKNDNIQTDEINNDHIQTEELKNDHIQTDEIKNDHIQTEELKNDHIQTDEIKNDHIQTDEIKNDINTSNEIFFKAQLENTIQNI